MKIKCNIPMLNKIKTIKYKIANKKQGNLKKELKYYVLLMLMIVMGLITVNENISKYNDINKEEYVKYELDKGNKETIKYDTAISSISTNISTINENENYKEESNDNFTKYVWPLNGEIVKECAVESLIYSNTLGMWKVHPGIDIKADVGREVSAVNDGRVIEVGVDDFYGVNIKIEHQDGYVSIYENLCEETLKSIGENVKQGEIIGCVGNTAIGESGEESHLHFEILKDGENVNPLEVLE